MPSGGDLAGMDPEGLQRTLGELLEANRAMQANFDEIRQQFPIQPSNVSDLLPSWAELEEGGLLPPEEAGEDFGEQLGVGGGIVTGTAVLHWTGSSPISQVLQIEHNLGVVPGAFHLQALLGSGVEKELSEAHPPVLRVIKSSLTDTVVNVRGYLDEKPAESNLECFWTAVEES